jgi:hypothetical protein
MTMAFNKWIIRLTLLALLFSLGAGCRSLSREIDKVIGPAWTGDYNVKLIVKEKNFNDPQNDTLGFYRIGIDKKIKVRTEIALRSQKRTWKGRLSKERHLLRLERWELDPEDKTYKRARNILQPRDPYFYIQVKPRRLTKVKVVVTGKGGRYSIHKSFYPPKQKPQNSNAPEG